MEVKRGADIEEETCSEDQHQHPRLVRQALHSGQRVVALYRDSPLPLSGATFIIDKIIVIY